MSSESVSAVSLEVSQHQKGMMSVTAGSGKAGLKSTEMVMNGGNNNNKMSNGTMGNGIESNGHCHRNISCDQNGNSTHHEHLPELKGQERNGDESAEDERSSISPDGENGSKNSSPTTTTTPTTGVGEDTLAFSGLESFEQSVLDSSGDVTRSDFNGSLNGNNSLDMFVQTPAAAAIRRLVEHNNGSSTSSLNSSFSDILVPETQESGNCSSNENSPQVIPESFLDSSLASTVNTSLDLIPATQEEEETNTSTDISNVAVAGDTDQSSLMDEESVIVPATQQQEQPMKGGTDSVSDEVSTIGCSDEEEDPKHFHITEGEEQDSASNSYLNSTFTVSPSPLKLTARTFFKKKETENNILNTIDESDATFVMDISEAKTPQLTDKTYTPKNTNIPKEEDKTVVEAAERDKSPAERDDDELKGKKTEEEELEEPEVSRSSISEVDSPAIPKELEPPPMPTESESADLPEEANSAAVSTEVDSSALPKEADHVAAPATDVVEAKVEEPAPAAAVPMETESITEEASKDPPESLDREEEVKDVEMEELPNQSIQSPIMAQVEVTSGAESVQVASAAAAPEKAEAPVLSALTPATMYSRLTTGATSSPRKGKKLYAEPTPPIKSYLPPPASTQKSFSSSSESETEESKPAKTTKKSTSATPARVRCYTKRGRDTRADREALFETENPRPSTSAALIRHNARELKETQLKNSRPKEIEIKSSKGRTIKRRVILTPVSPPPKPEKKLPPPRKKRGKKEDVEPEEPEPEPEKKKSQEVPKELKSVEEKKKKLEEPRGKVKAATPVQDKVEDKAPLPQEETFDGPLVVSETSQEKEPQLESSSATPHETAALSVEEPETETTESEPEPQLSKPMPVLEAEVSSERPQEPAEMPRLKRSTRGKHRAPSAEPPQPPSKKGKRQPSKGAKPKAEADPPYEEEEEKEEETLPPVQEEAEQDSPLIIKRRGRKPKASKNPTTEGVKKSSSKKASSQGEPFVSLEHIDRPSSKSSASKQQSRDPSPVEVIDLSSDNNDGSEDDSNTDPENPPRKRTKRTHEKEPNNNNNKKKTLPRVTWRKVPSSGNRSPEPILAPTPPFKSVASRIVSAPVVAPLSPRSKRKLNTHFISEPESKKMKKPEEEEPSRSRSKSRTLLLPEKSVEPSLDGGVRRSGRARRCTNLGDGFMHDYR